MPSPCPRDSRRLDTLTDTALVALYGHAMTELLRRGVVRSANHPIGDMAERLTADYYGVDRAPPNLKSYDVETCDGQKIQVKAMRRTKSSRTTLSALRSLDFDVLAAVIFAVDMTLIEVALIPVDVVREYMGWSDMWKANRLSVAKRLLTDPRVTRIPADAIASA